MNSVRPLPATSVSLASPLAGVAAAAPAARQVEAELAFHRGGGRTHIGRQRVPYPFHVTRAFHLDPARPDLATLYLQSASGGLYRGDWLSLFIHGGAGAAAHITTQAATIVHDTRGRPAALATHIEVARGGFLAYTPDPLVLFPGASIDSTTEVVLDDGASAVLADGFTWHDLDGRGRAFEACGLRTLVRDGQGRELMRDRGTIKGADFLGPASPAGPYRAVGTLLILGQGSERLDGVAFEQTLDALGCLAGVSPAPNGIGFSVRILAPDGGALARGLTAGFTLAFEAIAGIAPARRRK
jgi:urease accessory protein